MGFDVNNNFSGTFFGTDRHGFTTPTPDGSEWLQPFLPNPYPAPWLPIRRRDEGHPVGAGIVLSDGNAVGKDKSGALIPAGTFSGTQKTKANGGQYLVVQYGADDIGFTYNPQTGVPVAAVNERVVIAAPSDGAAADTVTLPNGNVVTISSGDLTFALACNLVPGGIARAVGYVIRNVFQYIGGVTVTSTTNGMLYTQDGNVPTKFKVLNYMHEMGTAIRTLMTLRVPYIGANDQYLTTLASGEGISGYTQTDFSRSFVHLTGVMGNAAGNLFDGCGLVPATPSLGSALEAGHFLAYNPTIHTPDLICGRVIGIEQMWPIRQYMDRVRTQFDRAQSFVGPFADKNPVTFMMGGSATRGLDYALNLSSNGLLRTALTQNKATTDPAFGTYVWFIFNSTK